MSYRDYLEQVVDADHRMKITAASAAYARHAPRDELVKVRVLQQFWVRGREMKPGEVVEIGHWLLSGLIVTGHVEKV